MDLVRNRKLRSVLIVSGMLLMGWNLFTFVMPIHCSDIGLSASTTRIIMGASARRLSWCAWPCQRFRAA